MFKSNKKKKAKQQKANKGKQQSKTTAEEKLVKSAKPVEEKKEEALDKNEEEKEEVIVTKTQIIRSCPNTPKTRKKKISARKEEKKEIATTPSEDVATTPVEETESNSLLCTPTNLLNKAANKILNQNAEKQSESSGLKLKEVNETNDLGKEAEKDENEETNGIKSDEEENDEQRTNGEKVSQTSELTSCDIVSESTEENISNEEDSEKQDIMVLATETQFGSVETQNVLENDSMTSKSTEDENTNISNCKDKEENKNRLKTFALIANPKKENSIEVSDEEMQVAAETNTLEKQEIIQKEDLINTGDRKSQVREETHETEKDTIKKEDLNKVSDERMQVSVEKSEKEEQIQLEAEIFSLKPIEKGEEEAIEKNINNYHDKKIEENDDKNEKERSVAVVDLNHSSKSFDDEKKRTIEELEAEILKARSIEEQVMKNDFDEAELLEENPAEDKKLINENKVEKVYTEPIEEIIMNDLDRNYDERPIIGADDFEMAYLSVSNHLTRMRNLMEFRELEKQRKEEELKKKDEEDKVINKQIIEEKNNKIESGECWEVQHFMEEENGVGKLESMRAEQIFICDRPSIGSVIVKTDENRLLPTTENSTIKVFVLPDIDGLEDNESEEKIELLNKEIDHEEVKEKEEKDEQFHVSISPTMDTKCNELMKSVNGLCDEMENIQEINSNNEAKDEVEAVEKEGVRTIVDRKNETVNAEEDREIKDNKKEILVKEDIGLIEINDEKQLNLVCSESPSVLMINEDVLITNEVAVEEKEEEKNNVDTLNQKAKESVENVEKERVIDNKKFINQIDAVETLNKDLATFIIVEDNPAHNYNDDSRIDEKGITGTNVEIMNTNITKFNKDLNKMKMNEKSNEANDENCLKEVNDIFNGTKELDGSAKVITDKDGCMGSFIRAGLSNEDTSLDDTSDSGINDSQDEYEKHHKQMFNENGRFYGKEGNLNNKEDISKTEDKDDNESTSLSSDESCNLNGGGLKRSVKGGPQDQTKNHPIKTNQKSGIKDKSNGIGNRGHKDRLIASKKKSSKTNNCDKNDPKGCDKHKSNKGLNFHKNCFVEKKETMNKKKVVKNQSKIVSTKTRTLPKITVKKGTKKNRDNEDDGQQISEISSGKNKINVTPQHIPVEEVNDDFNNGIEDAFLREESYTEIERSYLSTINEEMKELDEEEYNFIKNEEYFKREDNVLIQEEKKQEQSREILPKGKQNILLKENEVDQDVVFDKVDVMKKALKFLQSKNISLSFENIATYLKTVFGLDKQQCIEYIEMAKTSGIMRNIMNNDTAPTNRKVESVSIAIQTDDNPIEDCKLVTINTATQTEPIDFGEIYSDKNNDSKEQNDEENAHVAYLDHILSQMEQLNSTIRATATPDILGDPHDPRNTLYKHLNSQISHQQLVINQLVNNLTSTTKLNTLQLQAEQQVRQRRLKTNDVSDYETLSPSSAVLLSSCDNRKSNQTSRYGISRQPQQQFAQPSCYDNSTNNNNTMFVIGNNTLRGDINSIQSNFNSCTSQDFMDLAKPVLVNQRNSILVKSRQIKRSNSVRFHRQMDDSTETTLV